MTKENWIEPYNNSNNWNCFELTELFELSAVDILFWSIYFTLLLL